MNPRSIKRLEDARDACLRVREFTRDITFEAFLASDLLQSAVERQLEIIGESLGIAAKNDDSVQTHVPELPRIVAFRNRLIHGYDSVDPELVWDVLQTKIDPLLDHLKAVVGEIG